ncbi:MAG: hypothetical protein AB7I09_20365 [Planctomycetota bacterium]
MIFRHPVCKAPNGQSLRVRRALGTRDEIAAAELVEQVNTLLSDKAWRSPARRSEAERLFDDKVVRAFFDDMEPIERDTWAERESTLPLPGGDANDGYARMLMVGTTGSGKSGTLSVDTRRFLTNIGAA